MKRYLEWARREPSTWRLVVTLVLAASIFLAGLPLLIAAAGRWLDRSLGLPSLTAGTAVRVVAMVLIVAGGVLASWAVLAEARIGHGTPVPLIPTQRLVVVPPFTYCRNPMVLGTVLGYLGLSIWLASVSAIVLVLVLAVLLLLYAKVIEEGELEARFGDEYVQYRRTTPFLIPRLSRRP